MNKTYEIWLLGDDANGCATDFDYNIEGEFHSFEEALIRAKSITCLNDVLCENPIKDDVATVRLVVEECEKNEDCTTCTDVLYEVELNWDSNRSTKSFNVIAYFDGTTKELWDSSNLEGVERYYNITNEINYIKNLLPNNINGGVKLILIKNDIYKSTKKVISSEMKSKYIFKNPNRLTVEEFNKTWGIGRSVLPGNSCYNDFCDTVYLSPDSSADEIMNRYFYDKDYAPFSDCVTKKYILNKPFKETLVLEYIKALLNVFYIKDDVANEVIHRIENDSNFIIDRQTTSFK